MLILHLRGAEDDTEGTAVHKICRRLLRKKCSPLQRIHIHCFSSNVDQVKAWTSTFPHCYFGVTGLVRSFTPKQRLAVKEIAAERLLLETDSPHLTPTQE